MELEGTEVFRTAREMIEEGRHREAAAALRGLLDHLPEGQADVVRLELARALYGEGDVESARGELLLVARDDRSHPAAWLNLGAALGALGETGEEAEAYARANYPGSPPPELAYNQGLRAYEAGDARALREARDALGAEGGEAAVLEALQSELEEDPAAAAAAWGRAAAADPPVAGARANQARALAAAGQNQEALDVLGEPAGSESAAVRLTRGNALLGLDDRDAAREVLGALAAEEGPEAVAAAYNLGAALLDWKKARAAAEVLRGAAAQAPDDGALRLLLARACFASRAYAEAAELYARVVEEDPQHFRAHYNLAYSLEAEGRDDEAIDVYQKALKRRPSHYKTLNKLSRLFAKRGEFEAALKHADRSLGQELDANGEGFLARAVALKGMGRHDEAFFALDEASMREGKNPEVHRELAFAHRRMGRVLEAKESAKLALALGGDDPDTLVELGLAYLETEDDADGAAKAKKAFRQALDRAPRHLRALSGLAQASARIDPPEKALVHAREAVEAGGGYRAFDALGRAYQRNGEHKKAIDAFKHSLTRNKGYSPGYLGIAESYAALGDPEREAKYRDRYERVLAGEEARREGFSMEMPRGG